MPDSRNLPEGAKPLNSDFVPIDWAENDPKWSAVLELTKDVELPSKFVENKCIMS
jgi:hypothetical protein